MYACEEAHVADEGEYYDGHSHEAFYVENEPDDLTTDDGFAAACDKAMSRVVSAALYNKDPAVGPWPVAAAQLATTKFCYPCKVKKEKL